MKCPIDGNTLTMSERSGIEIDYCPSCRGVWLDRGELDKILERVTVHETVAAPVAPSATAAAAPVGGPIAASAPAPRLAWSGDRKRGGYSGSSYGYGHSGHGRKKHWLSEIFD